MKSSRLFIIFALLLASLSMSANENARRFTWGAETGGAIDLTGSDMSAFDFSASFGYANSWIRILGLSAGVDMMMSNSSRYFPLTARFSTGFSKKPTRLFMDLRCGCAINNLYDNGSKTSFYCSPGLGFNLAQGKTFSSYFLLSYIYNDIDFHSTKAEEWTFKNGMHMISFKIGILF